MIYVYQKTAAKRLLAEFEIRSELNTWLRDARDIHKGDYVVVNYDCAFPPHVPQEQLRKLVLPESVLFRNYKLFR